MARGDLVVDIIARDQASKAFDKVAGSAGKTSRTIKAGAIVAAAGFAAVGLGALKLAQGAADDQKAAAALATQLRNTTGATDKQVASVEDWITAQGKLTGITDDQLRPALAQLATATGSIHKAQRLASLAQDVAAGTGKNYATVVQALAKAQNGSVGGLSRLGIATKDAAGHTKDFATLQGELAAKFKGQASVQADTLSGKMTILKTQLSEAGESIGYLLIPVLTQLANFLVGNVLPAVTAFGNWAAANKPIVIALGVAVASFGAAFIVASVALKAYNAAATIVRVATIAWTNAQWALNLAMEANPIGLVVLAIAGLVAALVIAYKKSETFRNIVNGAFNAVKNAAAAALGWVKGNWPKILAILTGPFGLAALAIAKNWDSIVNGAKRAWDYIKGLPGKIRGAFSGIFSGLAGGLKSAINATLHLPLTIPKVNTHIPGVGTVGGQTLIPALAKGGIVTRPTLALIGEAGPERVQPLTGPNAGGMLTAREMQQLASLIGVAVVNGLNSAARTARTA